MDGERANPNHLNQEILLERVEKIYSDGRWNGRAEIAFWNDHYYMPFRSGSEHESSDGKIMMLRSVSREPRGWSLHNMIDTPGDDDEVHILTDSDRMVAYIPHEEENSSIGVTSSTLVTQSRDGITWTDPLPAYEEGFSFWKPISREGAHYLAADTAAGGGRVDLLKSADGVNWQKVSTIIEGGFTETALVFLQDHTLAAFIRQGRVALSPPPYVNWTIHEIPPLGGPAAARVGSLILVGGRTSARRFPDDQPGESRTGLFAFDPDAKKLNWKMNMLTQWGGDESYPHFCRIDQRRALMVWYSGEEYERGVPKQADLLLATLRVQ